MVRTRASSLPGASRFATGTYVGDGNLTQAIVGVGFRPKYVMVWRQTGGTPDDQPALTSDQDAGFSINWWMNAFTVTYRIDHMITSLDADGFTVENGGFTYSLNVLGQTYTYVCAA